MLDSEWLLLGVGALGGALVATVLVRWRAARVLAELQTRLQMSEFARHAMQERSDQARLQIGQLTKALADAHRQARVGHAPVATALPPQSEPAPLAPTNTAPDGEVLLTRRRPPEAFPDTQVL